LKNINNMKKLLGMILVLGLLLNGNAYARISIFSEASSNDGGWIAALIVLVPFFGAVWYSTHKEKKEWKVATQRTMNLNIPKYKKRKKKK